VRWIFDLFRFKNEFPEFIPSLALVSVVSAASKSVFTACREKPMTKSFCWKYGRTQCTSRSEKTFISTVMLSCNYNPHTLYFKNGTETDFGSHATFHITG